MKKLTAAALLLACMNSKAMAGYTTFGEPDCGQWIRDPSSGKRAWIAGYMSGLAAMFNFTNQKMNPLGQINSADQIFLWMNNYCQKNPLSSVDKGGVELFLDLVEKKSK